MIANPAVADAPDIQACACANLRRATRMVTQAYDAALRPAGLRATQFAVLGVLANRGEMRQSELADILGMDGTTLTRNLKLLFKSAWVQVHRGEDRRVRLVSITNSGRAVMDEALPLWRQVQSRFVAGLGDAQWSGLLGTLAAAVDVAQRE